MLEGLFSEGRMNRRKSRENAFIAMFEASFGGEISEIIEQSRAENEEYVVDEFGEALLADYTAHAKEIDAIIESRLKGWKVNRLAKVNLALLRLAVAEMCYGAPDMDSVVINEAVEIAKKYADEEDYQFVNGVLGNISRGKGGAASTAALPV